LALERNSLFRSGGFSISVPQVDRHDAAARHGTSSRQQPFNSHLHAVQIGPAGLEGAGLSSDLYGNGQRTPVNRHFAAEKDQV